MSASTNDMAKHAAELKNKLAALDLARSKIAAELSALENKHDMGAAESSTLPRVTMASAAAEKIALFRSLFRGRDDVFPRRWENLKTGRSGYAPTCRNEWVRGVCGKPHIKCGECPNQAFVPVNNDVK